MSSGKAVFRPRLFVVSSSEALDDARLLRRRLDDVAHLIVWRDGVFQTGDLTLSRLATEMQPGRYDGAAIVARADDLVDSRGTSQVAPRDNVVLELGMALAAFGPRRSFVVVEDTPERTKLPSDLQGWTTASFIRGDDESRMDSAADDIRAAIRGLDWEQAPVRVREAATGVLQLAAQDLVSKAGVSDGAGLHLWLAHRTDRQTVLNRVARARTKAKTQRFEVFGTGQGIVGYVAENEASATVDFTTEPYATADQATWGSLAGKRRFGMDFDLLDLSRKRYSVVSALPVFNSGSRRRLLGVLSVNVAANGSGPVPDFDSGICEEILEECAAVLGLLLQSHQ